MVAEQADQEGRRQFAQDRLTGSSDALAADLNLVQSLAGKTEAALGMVT